MSTVTLTQVIEESADRLWAVFTDLPGRPRWLCGLDAVDVRGPGPFVAGTVWCEHRTLPDGTTLTEEFRVEEATAPYRLVTVSSGAGVEYRTTYTFQPVVSRPGQRRTAVTVVQHGAPTATASRLMALVLGGFAARAVTGTLRRDLADLAAAVAPRSYRSASAA